MKMVKKKKSPLWIILGTPLSIILGLALIGGVLWYGGTHGWFQSQTQNQVTNTTILQMLDQPSTTTTDCRLSLNEEEICVNDDVTGTITDGKNTYCWVFIAYDGDWNRAYEGFTDASGLLTQTETISLLGIFRFRAICDLNKNNVPDAGDCLTNYDDLRVTTDIPPCPPDDDDDDDEEGGDDDGQEDGMPPVVCNSAYPIPTSQASCDGRAGCDADEYCKFYPNALAVQARCGCSNEIGCNDADFTQTNFEPSLLTSTHCADATGTHLDVCEGGLLKEWHCPVAGDECQETFINCAGYFAGTPVCNGGECIVSECDINLDCVPLYGYGYVCRDNACLEVTGLNCAEVVQAEGKEYGFYDPMRYVGIPCWEHCREFCGGDCSSSTGGTWGLCCGFSCAG